MFTSVLKHASYLGSVDNDGVLLTLRILAAFPSTDLKEPVLELTLSNFSETEANSLIENIDRQLLTAIDVTGNGAEFLIDTEDSPYTIKCSAVAKHQEYARNDFLKIAANLEKLLYEERQKNILHRKRVDLVVSFIEKTIDRVSRKRDHASTDDIVIKSQIEILSRVKSKLTADDF
jgi:uncharacterized UPF0160 family protein